MAEAYYSFEPEKVSVDMILSPGSLSTDSRLTASFAPTTAVQPVKIAGEGPQGQFAPQDEMLSKVGKHIMVYWTEVIHDLNLLSISRRPVGQRRLRSVA